MQDNWYELYQIKEDSSFGKFLFEDLQTIRNNDVEPRLDNYNCIYRAPLEDDNLNSLWKKFNTEQPEDFFGHSMAVSDIIVLYNTDDTVESFFVNSTSGFVEIPAFAEEVRVYKQDHNCSTMIQWSTAVKITDKVKQYFERWLREFLKEECQKFLQASHEGTGFELGWDSLVGYTKDILFIDTIVKNVDSICNNLEFFSKDIKLDLGEYQIRDTLHEFVHENKRLEQFFGSRRPIY